MDRLTGLTPKETPSDSEFQPMFDGVSMSRVLWDEVGECLGFEPRDVRLTHQD